MRCADRLGKGGRLGGVRGECGGFGMYSFLRSVGVWTRIRSLVVEIGRRIIAWLRADVGERRGVD